MSTQDNGKMVKKKEEVPMCSMKLVRNMLDNSKMDNWLEVSGSIQTEVTSKEASIIINQKDMVNGCSKTEISWREITLKLKELMLNKTTKSNFHGKLPLILR